MARYISTQYPSKNSGHQRKSKKGIDTERREMIQKNENKDKNTPSISGAHVGDATTPEHPTAPSRGASIGIHILEATK